MAGKKKEVSLQASITVQEQWDEMLEIKGLTVVDVYQQWCGPCKAVVSLLRKIKNELGDDLLHFATAEADRIEALEKYRGRCEPTFLFYGGGQLVEVLRGANAPLLQRRVLEELAKEKLVMEQGGERKTVEDEGLEEEEEEEEKKKEEEEEEEEEEGQGEVTTHDESILVPASEGYTLAIIKPDAVAHGNTDEILMKIQDAGFQILTHEERVLSEQVARDLYRHEEAEPYFEELVQLMSSGPSHLLVLSQAGAGDVVPAWLDFMGPSDVEEAKRDKPHSLRAQYGSRAPLNGVHGSADRLQAGRETALLFPHFRRAAGRGGQEGRGERTLALLRPAAARDRREELLSRVCAEGFTVALRREVTLTEEQMKHFYHRHADEDLAPALRLHMTSGPVLALVLARDDAVQRWRNLLGPADVTQAKAENPSCLRALFAVETEALNQLHGSASAEDAQREIDFFFPVQSTLALVAPDAMQDHRDEILEEIRRAGFSVSREKEEVLSREVAEELYQEHRDQPFFGPLLEAVCGGPCLMLVLTKENAVEEWRAMMGPVDPAEARETAPATLRARFASDILHQAVHGSSSEQRAAQQIQRLFRDLPSDGKPPGEAEERASDARGRVSRPGSPPEESDARGRVSRSGSPPGESDGGNAPDQQEKGDEPIDPGRPAPGERTRRIGVPDGSHVSLK